VAEPVVRIFRLRVRALRPDVIARRYCTTPTGTNNMLALHIAWMVACALYACYWVKALADWTLAHDTRAARIESALARVQETLAGGGRRDEGMVSTLRRVENALTVPYAYGGMPAEHEPMSEIERTCRARPAMEVLLCDQWRVEKTINEIRQALRQLPSSK
jgi:hypothetical protein